MKKIYWWVIISCLGIFISYQCWEKSTHDHLALCGKFNKVVVDSLLNLCHNRIILLTINDPGCFPCQNFLLQFSFPRDKYLGVYLNTTTHKLVWQALRTRAYPTTYIFNVNFNLLGKVEGTKNFNKRLKAVIKSSKKNSCDSVSLMLEYSLKGVLFYSSNDLEKAKSCFENSLAYGPYFFNNYMLYLLSEDVEQKNFYRKCALQHDDPLDSYIYDDFIHDLTID